MLGKLPRLWLDLSPKGRDSTFLTISIQSMKHRKNMVLKLKCSDMFQHVLSNVLSGRHSPSGIALPYHFEEHGEIQASTTVHIYLVQKGDQLGQVVKHLPPLCLMPR